MNYSGETGYYFHLLIYQKKYCTHLLIDVIKAVSRNIFIYWGVLLFPGFRYVVSANHSLKYAMLDSDLSSEFSVIKHTNSRQTWAKYKIFDSKCEWKLGAHSTVPSKSSTWGTAAQGSFYIELEIKVTLYFLICWRFGKGEWWLEKRVCQRKGALYWNS